MKFEDTYEQAVRRLTEEAEDLFEYSVDRWEAAKANPNVAKKVEAELREAYPDVRIPDLSKATEKSVDKLYLTLARVKTHDRSALVSLLDLQSSLQPKPMWDTYQSYLDTQIEKTRVEHEKLAAIVKEAASRAKLKVPVRFLTEREKRRRGGWGSEPSTSHTVYVGPGRDAPMFSIFEDSTVDDIMEAGDEDSFGNDPMLTKAYFDLIAEIRKPGSTSQPGKTLTLYTARPTRDRGRYDGAREIPSNVFLTNNLDHAEGLAVDLGGTRDVWKVRIDERHVVETLHAGRVREYQVVTDKQTVPLVGEMVLVIPG